MAGGDVSSETQEVEVKRLKLYDPSSRTAGRVSSWIQEVMSVVTQKTGAFSGVEMGVMLLEREWGCTVAMIPSEMDKW